MVAMCRETVHLILVLMEDEHSIKIANELFLKQKSGDIVLSATIKKPVKLNFKRIYELKSFFFKVYTAALLANNDYILEEFFELYEKNIDLPEESSLILESLSYVRNPSQIQKILVFAFTVSSV